MITIVRFIIVSFPSFLKRLLSYDPTLYLITSFAPILSVTVNTISKKGFLISVFFIALSFFSGLLNYPYAVLPFCLILTASPVFFRVNFFRITSRLQLLLIISSLYGILQFLFGYTSFEINWIRSGLGFAEERSFLEIGVTRPFSIFASMADFALFLNLFVFYYISSKKYFFALLVMLMVIMTGSRGMILGSLIASMTLVLKVKPSKSLFLLLPFLCSIPLFILIATAPFIYSIESLPFYLNPGSLIGRLTNSFLPSLSFLNDNLPWTLISPIPLHIPFDSYTVDNMYIFSAMFLGTPFSLYLLFTLTQLKTSRKNLYFLVLFLTYGCFADVITSFSLTFFLFFCLLSNDDSTTHPSMAPVR